jgi:uncharacterized RDD family membrane protein YckC
MDFLESYKIDSPENVEFQLSLAGLGSRTMAYIVDLMLRISIGLVFFISAALLDIQLSFASFSEWVIIASVILIFLLQWAYFVIFELSMNGQTPGKRLMKIRVVRDGGYPLTFFASAIRNLLRVVDFLPGLYGIGVLLIFVSKEKKRLGDYVAGTIVIHQQQTSLLLPAAAGKVESRFPLLRLTEQEKQVIRSFLERAGSLEWDSRVRVREKLYQGILPKIQSLYPEYQPEAPHLREAVLEELVRE